MKIKDIFTRNVLGAATIGAGSWYIFKVIDSFFTTYANIPSLLLGMALIAIGVFVFGVRGG